jgi:hypothetical protein
MYRFNFCSNIPGAVCGGATQTPTASFSMATDRTCITNYGYATPFQATFLTTDPTQGVAVTMQGSPCDTQPGFNYSTTFNVKCDPSASIPTVQNFNPNSGICNIQFSLASAAACPTRLITVVPALGAGWIVVIVAVVLGATYVGGGIAYKRHKFGASGVEAIPNIDFWRWVGSYIVYIFTCGQARPGYSAAPADDAFYTAYSQTA